MRGGKRLGKSGLPMIDKDGIGRMPGSGLRNLKTNDTPVADPVAVKQKKLCHKK